VFTTAEELNSQGAFHYLWPECSLDFNNLDDVYKLIFVKGPKMFDINKKKREIEFILSFDCVGIGDLVAVHKGNIPKKLLSLLADFERQGLISIFKWYWSSHQGDGGMFLLYGLPAVLLCRSPLDTYGKFGVHSKDNFDLLDHRLLQMNAYLSAYLVQRYASGGFYGSN
jgi:hypothetical protein